MVCSLYIPSPRRAYDQFDHSPLRMHRYYTAGQSKNRKDRMLEFPSSGDQPASRDRSAWRRVRPPDRSPLRKGESARGWIVHVLCGTRFQSRRPREDRVHAGRHRLDAVRACGAGTAGASSSRSVSVASSTTPRTRQGALAARSPRVAPDASPVARRSKQGSTWGCPCHARGAP